MKILWVAMACVVLSAHLGFQLLTEAELDTGLFWLRIACFATLMASIPVGLLAILDFFRSFQHWTTLGWWAWNGVWQMGLGVNALAGVALVFGGVGRVGM